MIYKATPSVSGIRHTRHCPFRQMLCPYTGESLCCLVSIRHQLYCVSQSYELASIVHCVLNGALIGALHSAERTVHYKNMRWATHHSTTRVIAS